MRIFLLNSKDDKKEGEIVESGSQSNNYCWKIVGVKQKLEYGIRMSIWCHHSPIIYTY